MRMLSVAFLLLLTPLTEAWSLRRGIGRKLISKSGDPNRTSEQTVVCSLEEKTRATMISNRLRIRNMIPGTLLIAGSLLMAPPAAHGLPKVTPTQCHHVATATDIANCGNPRQNFDHKSLLSKVIESPSRDSLEHMAYEGRNDDPSSEKAESRIILLDKQRKSMISFRGGGQALENIPSLISSLAIVNEIPRKYVVGGILASLAAALLYQYRKAIGERLQKLQNESIIFGGLRMTRVPRDEFISSNSGWNLFELDDNFKANYGDWNFTSIGEYLATLRPGAVPESVAKSKMFPNWLRSEIEAALTASMLKILGPSLGRAFLPALGARPIASIVEKATSSISEKFQGVDASTDQQEVADSGILPVSLMGIMALSEAGATKTIEDKTKRSSDADENQPDAFTPIEKMKLGEFGINPSMVTSNGKTVEGMSPDDSLIPNPFIVSKHWLPMILRHESMRQSNKHGETSGQMEDDMRDTVEGTGANGNFAREEPYDPHAKNMASPVPVDERLLPDLYMGWGDAKCTHTHREVLQNRLLCIIMNRLASNYHMVYSGKTEREERHFVVRLTENGKDIVRPHDFLNELLSAGNDIRMVVTTHPTSFGAALCVKQGEGGWANIPLAVFVNSGYENSNGQEAQALLPHSGLNLELRGPLIGAGERLTIQHFIGVEGFCGWKSNHYADVPWIKDIECGPVVSGRATVDIARVAALYGLLLNIVGTEMELPLGGYGMVGVCNDSAAIMEYIIHGETHVYPLTAVGKYSVQVMRKAREFQQTLQANGLNEEVKLIDDLIVAMTSLPSDIHACPSCVRGAGHRMVHCLPRDLPFKLMAESKIVSEDLVREAELLLERSITAK